MLCVSYVILEGFPEWFWSLCVTTMYTLITQVLKRSGRNRVVPCTQEQARKLLRPFAACDRVGFERSLKTAQLGIVYTNRYVKTCREWSATFQATLELRKNFMQAIQELLTQLLILLSTPDYCILARLYCVLLLLWIITNLILFGCFYLYNPSVM